LGEGEENVELKDILNIIAAQKVQFVDFKLVDLWGKWRHVTIPSTDFTEATLHEGIGFDASNLGYKATESSDLVLLPDLNRAFMDPNADSPTLSLIADVYDATTFEPFVLGPRSVMRRAEAALKTLTGATSVLLAPEYEFFIFEEARYNVSANTISATVDSPEGFWNAPVAGFPLVEQRQGYHQTPPADHFFNVRNEIVEVLKRIGVGVKYHHHEVGTSQSEIEVHLGDALKQADDALLVKYITKSVARKHGYVATFMPKPLYLEAGTGFHVHQTLTQDSRNMFYDQKDPLRLSELAYWYTGGILKHLHSMAVLTNPSTNSYKRLVAGYEAPTAANFAPGNRAAAIRIPQYVRDPAKLRIEVRIADASCNPYLAFGAMLMAAADGIVSRVDPRNQTFPDLPRDLVEAAANLEKDREFLTRDGVFPPELLDTWVAAKRKEHVYVQSVPHPAEFKLYFDV
jgi:glutamine synthetase